MIGRMLQALPAAFAILLIGLFEASAGRHVAVFEERRVFVAFPIQRREHAFVELGAFFQHSLRRIKARVFKTRDLRNGVDVGDVLDRKQHVFNGGFVGHVLSLSVENFSKRRKKTPGRRRRKGFAKDAKKT